jgi:4-nitrophenyl phosphatase
MIMSSQLTQLAARLDDVKLFLLDLDGTVYLEDELIPGAVEFIQRLRALSLQYVFVTNNSSRSAQHYLEKLTRLGFLVTLENIFTSGQATAHYLNRLKSHPSIYLVGTSALHAELTSYGITIREEIDGLIDYLVVGFDRELTYAKLEAACELLDRGVPFVATNPDLVCPIRDHRYIPDCGSICAMLENATGRKPVYIGKPDKTMVSILSEQKKVALDRIAMIGDRLYTDIALGANAGIMTICVLSGESDALQVSNSPHRPDFVIDSIAVLNSYL